jgi:predicted chitinase
MKKRDFPSTHSVVEVVFADGEVKNYVISASPSIGGYLAQQAGETGILSLYNNDESYAIPLVNIREWRIIHRPEAAENAN